MSDWTGAVHSSGGGGCQWVWRHSAAHVTRVMAGRVGCTAASWGLQQAHSNPPVRQSCSWPSQHWPHQCGAFMLASIHPSIHRTPIHQSPCQRQTVSAAVASLRCLWSICLCAIMSAEQPKTGSVVAASLSSRVPVKLSAWPARAYACVDALDANGFSECFSSDIWLRFANQPPIVGRESARLAFAAFFSRLASLTHHMLHEWRVDSEEGSAVLLESTVTYITDNGGTCTVPAVSSWRLRVEPDGVERGYWLQIYVDLAPLHALLALPPTASTTV